MTRYRLDIVYSNKFKLTLAIHINKSEYSLSSGRLFMFLKVGWLVFNGTFSIKSYIVP